MILYQGNQITIYCDRNTWDFMEDNMLKRIMAIAIAVISILIPVRPPQKTC